MASSSWKGSGGARTGKNALVEACDIESNSTGQFLPSPTHLGKLRDGWLSEGKRPLTRADLDKAPLNRKGVTGDTQGSKVRAGSGKGRVIDESDSDDGDELTRACAQSKKQRVVSDSESEESEVGSDLNSKSVALTSRKSRPETIQGVGNAERKARVSQTMQDSEDVMDEDSKVTNAPSGACQHSPGSVKVEKQMWTRKSRASKRTHGLIYKITNRKNGKVYVGMSLVSFKKRMQGHKSKDLYAQDAYSATTQNGTLDAIQLKKLKSGGEHRSKTDERNKHVPQRQLQTIQRKIDCEKLDMELDR